MDLNAFESKMRILVPLFLAVCLVSACSNQNLVGVLGFVPQDVSGDENSVSISSDVWLDGGEDAQPHADCHCGQFGKRAQFVRVTGNKAYFACQ